MQATSVEDLVEQAQRGSSEAAGALYQDHYQSIYRYLYYRTGDVQSAEDLTAQVFFKMVQVLSAFRLVNIPFRAWLFQIARNISIDHYRHSSVHPFVPLDDEMASSLPDPAEAVEQGFTSEWLRNSLSQLSGDQRDVILLRFVEGMPVAEVARLLHRSPDSVKALQRRGLLALREKLREEV